MVTTVLELSDGEAGALIALLARRVNELSKTIGSDNKSLIARANGSPDPRASERRERRTLEILQKKLRG